jgi:hypothetical protein
MKLNKNGSRPVGREYWYAAAASHLGAADDLDWLVARSLDSLARAATGARAFPDLPADSPQALLMARTLAEASAETEEPDEGSTLEELTQRELFCLLDVLMRVARSYRRHAETEIACAQEVRPGRPKNPSPNPLAAMGERRKPRDKPAIGERRNPSGKPGPRPEIQLSDENLMRLLEHGRSEWGDTTARKTLGFVASLYLEKQGVTSPAQWRVSKVLRNLERRVSALKRRTRSSNENLGN